MLNTTENRVLNIPFSQALAGPAQATAMGYYGQPIIRRLLAMALVAAIVVGCSTLDVGSDYDKQAGLANYHTFAMMQRERPGAAALAGLPNAPGQPGPLVLQRLQDSILEELKRKGYQQVNDPLAADFVVDYAIGTQERLSVSSSPGPFGGYGGPGWWGTYDVRQIPAGALSIDIFDSHTRRPVWHGWAKKDLTRTEMEQSEQPIRDAVAAVLAKFPPP